MGLLHTTPGTRRILDTLNTAFDGPGKGLQFIRNAASPGSPLYRKVARRNWRPGTLARMLRLLPFDQAKPPSAGKADETKRWFYFLRRVIGPTAAFPAIRDALADAILNQDSSGAALNIVRVSFDHVELDGPANPNVVIYDAPVPGLPGGNVRHITLFTVRVPDVIVDPQPDVPEPDEPPPISKPPWEHP
jgi:hypothetical protein